MLTDHLYLLLRHHTLLNNKRTDRNLLLYNLLCTLAMGTLTSGSPGVSGGGGSFHALPTPHPLQTQEEEASLTLPRDTTLPFQQEEQVLSWAPGNSSATEKPSHFELPGSSKRLLVPKRPSNLPLLSFKSLPLSPSCPRPCLESCHTLFVCNSSIPNQCRLLGK